MRIGFKSLGQSAASQRDLGGSLSVGDRDPGGVSSEAGSASNLRRNGVETEASNTARSCSCRTWMLSKKDFTSASVPRTPIELSALRNNARKTFALSAMLTASSGPAVYASARK